MLFNNGSAKSDLPVWILTFSGNCDLMSMTETFLAATETVSDFIGYRSDFIGYRLWLSANLYLCELIMIWQDLKSQVIGFHNIEV